MSTLNTVQKFALADTYIAKENVRAETVHDADAIRMLAGSIRHFGRLLEPLKAYIDADGKAAVWDGGRRHTALRMIAADGDGVGSVIVEGVDVFITSQDDAAAASLATFVREDQHPADQFLAYNAKFDEGMSPEQIAAAFAVEAKTVTQLLRFRTLAPEVLEAFRAGRFGLDVCYAFTLTTEHDKQRALLEATGDKGFDAWTIKRALTKGAVTARDQWARFIGREAYEAAGGTFLMDLFSQHSADEQWSDGDLVRSLAQQKLNAMEAELLTEGWSKVIVSEDSYGWQRGYTAMKAEGPTKKGKARPFTTEQMAKGVVFIVFGHSDHEVKAGYEKDVAAAVPTTKAKADPAKYGFGHKGHHVMTSVATEATRIGLMRNPEAAMDALATQLAWAILRRPQYGGVSDQLASQFVPEHRNGRAAEVVVAGQDEFAEAIASWKARLPIQPVAFYEAVAALPVDEKQALMGLCFAASLDANEEKFDGWVVKPNRWRHLGWMARHAGVNVAEAWSADDDFLRAGSKDALFVAMEGVGMDPEAYKDCKKALLVTYVGDAVREKAWVPQVLATFTDVADPEPKSRASEDDDGDAATEAEYLGWIAAMFDLVGGDDADAMAAKALADELARVGVAFGDENYHWGRDDAASCASDYLATLDEQDAEADA